MSVAEVIQMQGINLGTKRVRRFKLWATTFLITTLPNLVMASEDVLKRSDETSKIVLVGALLLVSPLWIYTANKWRLWMWGFKVGYADGGDFKSAFKWSFYSVVLTGIVGGIAFAILKFVP
jgi:hypothetical protein